MILDSSSIVAILLAEPEAEDFAKAIESAAACRISAASYVESAIVIDSARDAIASRKFDDFFRASRIKIEPVTPHQAEIARQAYRDYGKGSGHPANLNFGDCYSYALARDKREPILFKGDDFVHTDLRSAV